VTPDSPETPDIAGYAEYRTYLRDRYESLKARDKRFSHRFINSKCQARSSGWFGDILAGRQRLKHVQVRPLVAVFKLDKREHEYLDALVDLERADAPDIRMAAMERWLSLKGQRREAVDQDRFAFFEHWYHLALREMLGIVPFDGNYEALGAALRPPIRASQAREAIDLLQRLGLVLPQTWNRRLSDMPVLVKTPDGEARHWHHILKDMMRLAPRALEVYKKEERDFSALTLSLSPDGFRRAGEAVAELRKKLLFIAEKDRGQNRVYQALFQVFPLTGTLEAQGD
jgi:uncharacterized protein (TIGR02147 family)